MENSAISRICTFQQQDQHQSTFHLDNTWTSSIDDLLLFDHDQNAAVFSSSLEHFHSHLSSSAASHLKQRKVVATVLDDDLEDTATSPPHPAIIFTTMGRISWKQRKKQRAMINQTKQKGKFGSEEYGEIEERSIEVGFVGRDNNCSTGLKNIGLCLVPLSMAVNYFG